MAEADAGAGSLQSAAYVQIWAEQTAQVIGQVAGAPTPCTAVAEAPAEAAPAGEQDLWALVTSSGALRGEMWLSVPRTAVLRLAQTFMGEPANAEAELTADHKDALIELLRQVAGLVTTAAKKRWGEIQLHVEMAAAAPSWPPAETFWLQIGEAGPARLLVEMGLSAALTAELRAEKAEPAAAEAAKAQAPAPPPSPPPADADAGAMDRLKDVQLAVTMRFGARRLLLREVLELGPGTVIELDRKVQEPVDLLLDGRLIARGEVVVIDGNYGLRVTDTSPLSLPPAQR